MAVAVATAAALAAGIYFHRNTAIQPTDLRPQDAGAPQVLATFTNSPWQIDPHLFRRAIKERLQLRPGEAELLAARVAASSDPVQAQRDLYAVCMQARRYIGEAGAVDRVAQYGYQGINVGTAMQGLVPGSQVAVPDGRLSSATGMANGIIANGVALPFSQVPRPSAPVVNVRWRDLRAHQPAQGTQVRANQIAAANSAFDRFSLGAILARDRGEQLA